MLRGSSTLFLCAVSLGACSIELDPAPETQPDDLVQYQLVPRGNAATLDQVVGVSDDGGSFWMMDRDDDGSYWTPDRLELYQVDRATGERSPSIVLDDHWERLTG
ncbi:MAG TPA: hypothetical protein VHE35_20370, partial [Kofleriaceae bacterium]|nr:hypothetical protein [Kofleriaceae bacterium]